jgi:hypothetical protein
MCKYAWKPNFLCVRLIHCVDRVRCLRTTATNRPIIHPPGDMQVWTAMVMTMPAGENSWLVHQSSLEILPAVIGVQIGGMDEVMRILPIQYLWYLTRSSTYRKILQHGVCSFTLHPKEGDLQILITLTNPSPCQVWIHDPRVQWQAHQPLHHQVDYG